MIVAVLLLLCVCITIILIKPFSRQNKPPGPMGLPFVGYLPYLNPTEPHITLADLSKKYGSIYGLYMGQIYTVVISDSTIVREILKLDVYAGRAPLYLTHGIMGGYGLICAEGQLWKNQRKLTVEWLKKLGMSKFNSSRQLLEKRIMCGVNSFIKLINEFMLTSNEIDPAKYLNHTIGNIMNDLVFGVTYDEHDETWEYLQHLQEEGVKHIGVAGVVNFLPILRFLPNNKKIINFLLNGKRKTHDIYDNIIKNIQTTMNATNDIHNHWNKTTASVNDTTINNKYPCVAEMFLNETKHRSIADEENDNNLHLYSKTQMKHLLADLFGAGVDTTVTTLRWFLLFVSINSHVQNKIRKEMQTNLDEQPSLNSYEKLPYLKACIAESQRIRSVVPLGFPHGTVKETVLHGYYIPKNTLIIPLQWAIHMDPNVWSEPGEFRPERFIDDCEQFILPQQFLPFQTGKRMCVGDELAKMLLFLYASNIIYNFELNIMQKPDNMNGQCGITLTPHNYTINFKKIQQNN